MLIGIDWGGTKIEGIAMEPNGAELLRIRKPTPKGDYPGCVKLVVEVIHEIEARTGRSGTVGIGIPGSLDPVTGLGKGCNSTWLLGKPVEKDVRAALGRDIRMVNDADCLAMSEAVDGAGAGFHVVFAVILGTGVGAGIAINGRAHHGPNNSAGEWGHNPLPHPMLGEAPGPACYCGRHGCLETWLSGPGFEADYARHAGEQTPSREIIARKRAGEPLANAVWDRYIDRLGRGLSVVVNTLDPDVFVLGGGMSNIDEIYAELPTALKRHVFSTAFQTPVLKARHGDSSGVRGAAWLWK